MPSGCSSPQRASDQKIQEARSENTSQEKITSRETPKEISPAAAKTLKCSKNSDTRLLELFSKNSGCELHYSKFQKTQSIASAKHGESYCREALGKVQLHLENAGYICEWLWKSMLGLSGAFNDEIVYWKKLDNCRGSDLHARGDVLCRLTSIHPMQPPARIPPFEANASSSNFGGKEKLPHWPAIVAITTRIQYT